MKPAIYSFVLIIGGRYCRPSPSGGRHIQRSMTGNSEPMWQSIPARAAALFSGSDTAYKPVQLGDDGASLIRLGLFLPQGISLKRLFALHIGVCMRINSTSIE